MELVLEKYGKTWIAETPEDRQMLRELAVSAGCTVTRLKANIKLLIPAAEEVFRGEEEWKRWRDKIKAKREFLKFGRRYVIFSIFSKPSISCLRTFLSRGKSEEF